MSVSLELLTDEDILDYTRENGRDHVLYDHRDISLRSNPPMPIPGGVYDSDIFGSIYSDRCLCKKIQHPSKEPCPYCGARVYTKEEGLRRFARIELPFYYLSELRFALFKELFDDIFSECNVVLNFANDDLKRNGYCDGNSRKKLGIKAFDMCQFNYNDTKKELEISEFITDESKCSYEGIIKILEEFFPDRLNEFKKMINRYYIVLPSMMRPFSITKQSGTTKFVTHKMSMWYSMIIRLCCVENKEESAKINYREVMKLLKTPGEKVRYTGLLRAMLNAGKRQATGLLNSSKTNFARLLYAVRTPNSARCPIVPSTTLAIDELGVPTHIAYEMCREGFIKYLMKELNFTEDEAKTATKDEALNEKTQQLFKEYAEKQIVLEFSHWYVRI